MRPPLLMSSCLFRSASTLLLVRESFTWRRGSARARVKPAGPMLVAVRGGEARELRVPCHFHTAS